MIINMEKQFEKIIQSGPLEIDVPKTSVAVMKEPGEKIMLELTPIECKILVRLAQSPGYIFTREQLIESVWGDGITVEARSVDKHISSLRKKLGRDPKVIRTVSGLGYQFIDSKQK
jgi:two-component system alkaline phosphatase synthesis response regulator PhoP